MKPKYSTGYFTPQANRVKKNTKPRRSESHENLTGAMEITDSVFEKLMSCPIKRQLVLNLIASEKDNIEKYKRREDEKKKIGNESPLSKVQKKHLCESPTALLRRRALEQRDRQSPLSENQSDDKSRSSSRQSNVSSDPSPIPFSKLLDGVVAYVELKSKDEKDRSKGAKVLLESMGATVRDKFTKDVTHVIFKDGSYTTYHKAKLLKVHLVSVLWIDAVRSSHTKVSEKKFPALRTEAYDRNDSSLCSQLQKDYEEIVRDELRRSLATGTPLPSTQTLIDRRRTIMTPMPSTSRFSSQEFRSSQDREVARIMQSRRKTISSDKAGAGSPLLSRSSPEITDDDSDLTPFINGSIIKRREGLVIPIPEQEQVIINAIESLGDYTTSSMELTNTDSSISPAIGIKAAWNSKKSELCGSNMDLTTLGGRLIIDESGDGDTKKNDLSNTTDNSIYDKKTPKLKSKKSLQTNIMAKRSSDDLFNIPDESIYKRQTRQLKSGVDISSDTSTTVSDEIFLKDKSDHSSHSAMSTLQLSHQDGVQILSKNTCAINTDPLQIQQENIVTSSRQVSAEKVSSIVDKSTSTNMSSLHISSDSRKDKESTGNKISDKSSSTNMSTLHISSDSNKDKENIVNKVAEISSTNMSVLLVSCDSIKDKANRSTQENQTKISNNFVNIDDKIKSNNKSPLKKIQLNQMNNSNTSNNKSFSPLSPDIINGIFQALEESPLPDQYVTKRRGRYSANKSIMNVPSRKTMLPDDNATGSNSGRKSKKVLREEASPSKKLKADSRSEHIVAKTPKKKKNGLEDSDGNTRKSSSKELKTDSKSEQIAAKTPKKKETGPEDSDGNTRKSPSKKLKTDSKSEQIAAKTPKKKETGPEDSDGNTRKSSSKELKTDSKSEQIAAKTPKKKETGPEDSDGNTRKSPSKKLKTDSKSEQIVAKTPKKKETGPEDSDGNTRKSPSKKLKTDSKSEQIAAKTPKKKETGPEDSDGNTRKSRGRRQTSIQRSEPDSKSKKTNKSKSRSKTSSSDPQSAPESSGSDKKGKKVRKLYNPDESIQDVIESDEQERENKRTKVKEQNSHEGVILNPNVVCVTSNVFLTAKAKAFVDQNNIDIQSLLNKESEDSELEKTSAKAKKKNKEKRISVDSDADEQQELAEEFINKKKNNKSSSVAKKLDVRSEGKIVRRRQSVRLSQRPKKNLNLDDTISSPDERIGIPKRRKSVRSLQRPTKLNLNSSTSSSEEKTIVPITPTINRRSTMEFQTMSQMSAKKRLKIDKMKRPSIVCTKMHKDQIQVFNQIVRKLGGFVIEDEVSSKTTHLVAGEAKRTINMLRAMAMGCWVLKHEWLLLSLEEGRWLPEEDYEETDFSPAVQQSRLQRQAFGPSYSMDVFQHCEPIYISRGSTLRCSDLRELVSLCKGKVVTATRNAGIVVGELVRHEGVKCVRETWVLDSITFNKKMPLKKYIIPPNTHNSPIV